MTQANEQQRLREAFVETPPDARASEECPDSEGIWAAVTGELPPAAFRELAAHAIECPVCSQAWALARDISAGADRKGERRRGPWAVWWSLAATAAAVAVVALTFQLGETPPGPPPGAPAFRAPVEEPVRSLLPAGGTVAREDCVLRWSGPDGARYDLTVATEDLETLLLVQGLEQSSYHVGPEALASVPAGGKLVWQVEAVLADGTRLASRSFVQRLE